MDIKSQIRKYKIQKNELTELWNVGKLREVNIHQAEMDRITIKTQEFKEECQIQEDLIRKEQINKLEKLSELQAEFEKIGKTLSEINGNKFKLREYSLAQIQADNRVKKDIRRNRDIYTRQLNDIQAEINKHQEMCNKKDDYKRQINEDFYNWRNECSETHEKMSELQPNDRKYKILADYLNELSIDTRGRPDDRITELDAKCRLAEQQIQHLGYQYSKLQTYMETFGNTIGQTQLVMSAYLQNASEQIPILKSKQRELSEVITSYQSMINDCDIKIKELGEKDIPLELKEQTQRAKDRLRISHQRLDAEYEPLVNNLQTKIISLEQQLLQEHHLTQLEQLQINSIDGNNAPINNTIYQTNTDGVTSNETISQTISNTSSQPDFTGKSRKEIERIKKEMIRQNQSSINLDQAKQTLGKPSLIINI